MHWTPSEIPYNVFVDCAGDSSISLYTTQEYSAYGSSITYSDPIINTGPEHIDYEADMCIMDYGHFERVLFDELNRRISINPNRDRCDYRDLRVRLMNLMTRILEKFVYRKIIENFSIYGISSEFNYITIRFGILRKSEWLCLEKSFMDYSKNYGFR